MLTEEKRRKIFAAYVEIARDCRRENHRSQSQVAQRMDISTQHVSSLEGNQRVGAMETIIALCAASGVKKETVNRFVAEILAEEEWEE